MAASRAFSAAAAVSAWGCFANLAPRTASAEAEFSSCDAIGDGLKAEFWKQFHSNVNVMALESESVQMMITRLRDQRTSPAHFKHFSDRLATVLVEQALSQLPAEEVEVETPHGNSYQGLALEDDSNLLGVTITADGVLMEKNLRAAVPGLEMAFIWMERGAEGAKQVARHNLPADLAKRHVLILEPVSGQGKTLKGALDFLLAQGMEQDHIHVIALTMSPEVADMLRGFKEVQVTTATIDSGLSPDTGFLQPGMGKFSERYAQDER
ncbi:UKL3 [Symbiodinium sp. KB8]|nr:UKL3 [Symbiodinium sp. KB8]